MEMEVEGIAKTLTGYIVYFGLQHISYPAGFVMTEYYTMQLLSAGYFSQSWRLLRNNQSMQGQLLL